MDLKEIFTASMILFAVIDIIGATPIVISLRKKVGKIQSEKATLVSMLIMIGFLFVGEEILNLIGIDINSSYKRASNILDYEMKNNKIEMNDITDPAIFKSDFEKNLYKKINVIKKYYSTINSDENFEKSLSILAETKKEVFEFFDNVKVNEDNETLRKNRLELINMLCKTFQNYINFRFVKAHNE